ncbi:hypothetical protein C1H46_018048 [Malus baccata]|uniref:Alanine--tRNA ligase n=1 Tax=Malus baccata TaxID=106549 RepID=A0A540MCG7_MALBA|nr:hypothetical protein C1H46_018048 [Malus baccata]
MLVESLSSAKESGTVPCLSGKDAFLLYDTYGFPVEITAEVAEERGVSIDINGFDIEMENQRRQSQAAHSAVKLSLGNSADVADTKFLGYETLSATAVVESLIVNGNPVLQVSEGSEVEVLLNRTPFYWRSWISIYSASELVEIEGLVNKWVGDATPLQTKVMPLADAKGAGAIAMFGEKYGEEVRVVEVPGVSMELCGGTHVSNTSEIRGFKIISEQGIASGIRRIEAVAGDAFIEYVNARDYYMKQLCSTLKVKAEEVTNRVDNLLEELRMTRNEASTLREKAAVYKASITASKAISVGTSQKVRVLVESMEDTDADSLKKAAEYLIETLEDPAAVILGSCPGDKKVSLVAAFTPGVVKLGIQAGKFIGPIAKLCGGGGGGRPNFAQAGGRKPENLSNALEKARSEIISVLSEKSS